MKAVSLVALLLVASASTTTVNALDLHKTAATVQQDITKADNAVKKAEGSNPIVKTEVDKIEAKAAQLEGKVEQKVQEEKPAIKAARSTLSLAQQQSTPTSNNKKATVDNHATIPHFSAKDLATVEAIKQFVGHVEKVAAEEEKQGKKGQEESKKTSSQSVAHDDQSETNHQKGGHHSKFCQECNQLAPVAVGVAGDKSTNCDNFDQIIGSLICGKYFNTPLLKTFVGECHSLTNDACHFLKSNHEYFSNNDPCDFVLCGTDPFGLL